MIDNFLLSPSLPVPRSRSYCWRKEMLAGSPGFFLRGGAIQGGRTDQKRPEEQVSSGELGCLRLYDERFEKLGYLSNFGTSKLIFFGKDTTLPLSVRRWMCIRASKERLSSPIPLFFPSSLPPTPFDACYAGYSCASSINFFATENSSYFKLSLCQALR